MPERQKQGLSVESVVYGFCRAARDWHLRAALLQVTGASDTRGFNSARNRRRGAWRSAVHAVQLLYWVIYRIQIQPRARVFCCADSAYDVAVRHAAVSIDGNSLVL